MTTQSRIKAQAREHEAFRRRCVQIAQGIHRWDMRFKLGLLQDHAAIEKQTAREAAEHLARKQKLETPTVKTEAQTKSEAAAAKDNEKGTEKVKLAAVTKPRIRPLSEAKAIDAGANFVSESFLLAIGVGLILFENWRRGEKETSRREDVNEKIRELEGSEKSARKALVELENEILRLKGENVKDGSAKKRILPKEVWELEEEEVKAEEKQPPRWISWVRGFGQRNPPDKSNNAKDPPDLGQNHDRTPAAADQMTNHENTTKSVIGPKRMVWPFNSTTEPIQSHKGLGISERSAQDQQSSPLSVKKTP